MIFILLFIPIFIFILILECTTKFRAIFIENQTVAKFETNLNQIDQCAKEIKLLTFFSLLLFCFFFSNFIWDFRADQIDFKSDL